MLYYFLFSFLAFVPFSAVADGILTIYTPGNVIQCENSLLTYSGGTGPYIISVLPGQSLSGAYETLFTQPASSTSVTWLCDIGVGTTLTFGIKDSTGAVQYSGVAIVGASPTNNETCIGINAVAQASILLTASSNTLGTSATGASSSVGASSAGAGSITAAATSSAPASATTSATRTSDAVDRTNGDSLLWSIGAILILAGLNSAL